MASAPAAALIAGGLNVASNITKGVSSYKSLQNLQAVNEYNARLVEEKQKALNYEEAMNENLLRLNAYSEIGSGKAVMAGRGNIGTSAESAVINSYLNLAGDLSAMSFNYNNKRFSLETERQNYLYQASIAKSQKKSAIFGSVLSTFASIGNGVLGYVGAGGLKSSNITDINGNYLGKAGGYGVWNGL